MTAGELEIGMKVDTTDDPFYNSIVSLSADPIRTVERFKPSSDGIVYVYYDDGRVITYPRGFEVNLAEELVGGAFQTQGRTCSVCGDTPAPIHYTVTDEGDDIDVWACRECAAWMRSKSRVRWG